jgi:adenylosuccinate synthase
LGSPPDVLAVTHLDRVVAELNLCTSYGNVHGRQVATIPMPDDPSDFDFRRQVTDMLFEATPTYMFQGMDLSVMPEEWAKIIADHLQTPLGIMSFGPAPKDKISIERVLS